MIMQSGIRTTIAPSLGRPCIKPSDGVTLVIAKLDRLSCNLRFIAELQDSRVKFVCADMADAAELTIHIFASSAQHERNVISERTKRASRAVKELEADPIKAEERRRRGKNPLGNPNGAAPLWSARRASQRCRRPPPSLINVRRPRR